MPIKIPPVPLVCPKCHEQAKDLELAPDLIVNFCQGCKGLWFDQGELANILGLPCDIPERSLVIRYEKTTPYHCPRCENPLQEMPYSLHDRTKIDWCSQCGGLWLDQHELESLRVVAAELKTKSSSFRLAR